MRGFVRFFGKELVEIVRTWRVLVLPGLLLFFAVSSPPLAKLTPQLLESVAQGQQGVRIVVPEPTYLDAYAQWVKNLQQLVAIALLLTSGGMVAGERASGTAVLVLTKPVSRTAFVVAKFLAQATLVVVATTVAAVVCWGTTWVVFGEAPVGRIAGPTGAWLAWAVLLVAVMTVLSARLKSLAASGAGIGAFFALSVLSLWGPALRHSPAGLAAAPGALLAGEDLALAWPLITTAVGVTLLVAVAAWAFSRAEI